jgi:signal transduction histidine kinase
LDHLIDTSPTAAKVMLATITERLKSTELVLRQSEKMAQLGTLTAGIAHELNNPASAVQRGADHLSAAISDLDLAYNELFSAGLSVQQQDRLSEYQIFVLKQSQQPLTINNLERSDREGSLESWLKIKLIQNPWEYAPTLVNMGFDDHHLDRLYELFPDLHFKPALSWLTALFTIHTLLNEIHLGTIQIGEIVKSLKSYVYLDQDDQQWIDIHEGLENTLVILRSKLKDGITINRKYGANLPEVQAYGSELNQVWTNIIDNAVDAMEGKGEIIIETRQQDNQVIVEIEDSGPGIPEEIQGKIFSPFFTTKPVNKGTGLGLNISFNIIKKHKGQITVSSQPGRTRFSVQLPINFDSPGRET